MRISTQRCKIQRPLVGGSDYVSMPWCKGQSLNTSSGSGHLAHDLFGDVLASGARLHCIPSNPYVMSLFFLFPWFVSLSLSLSPSLPFSLEVKCTYLGAHVTPVCARRDRQLQNACWMCCAIYQRMQLDIWAPHPSSLQPLTLDSHVHPRNRKEVQPGSSMACAGRDQQSRGTSCCVTAESGGQGNCLTLTVDTSAGTNAFVCQVS